MKICPNCSFDNTNDSLFCQECGSNLHLSKLPKKSSSKSIYHQLNTGAINDVIFQPPKKQNNGLFWVIVLGVIFFVFMLLIISSYSSNNLSSLIGQPTPTESVNKYTMLSNLSIENYDVKWIGEETYFVGTMKNLNNYHLKDIVVRIDFAWDKAMSKLFDTRYVTVSSVPSNGAFTFQLPVSVYQDKQYWYQYKIESANTY